MGFVHLHVHTEFSLLDGASRIKDLVASAKEMGMNSLAITDHGNMYGVIDFYKECKKQGIKPILGCEVYTARTTRFSKDPAKDKSQGHLVLLAENDVGYKNLMKIVSKSYLEGFYYKPRVDKELLREYSEGIIALSACLAGDLLQNLLQKNYEGAKREALEMIDIFGKENYFIELQDHGLEEQVETNPLLIKLSKELDLKLVATNDVHYTAKEDAEVHDVLLCVQTATNVDEEGRMKFPSDDFYLKSEDEMRKLFITVPEACDNTQDLADRCNVEIEFGKFHLPNFESPDGMTNQEYLRKLCEDGLQTRYFENDKLDIEEKNSIIDRLNYELSVIEQMGYVEYFLVVWDFINYAKVNGIMVGPGRGSAAGSIVAYALKITDIDPLKYSLIFERFLNPERISMPDIDIDFCYERRQEVIDYVVQKYGKDKVAQIITFGTMKAKAGIRDVARALNVSYAEADWLAKAVPNVLGITIEKALHMNPELKAKYEVDSNAHKILDFAKALEGISRHASTHAAGVVISKEKIDEYVPLCMGEKGVSTQFTMTTVEELGLLKVDFLGLKNLTIIRKAIDLVEKNHGNKIIFENMELDDKSVFKLIADGNTQGIFQLESLGMTQFMKNLKPDCMEDIIAGISLYRPGPMDSIPKYIENKKNPNEIEYLHESLEPILSVTYGCLVYQEQVMQIVRELAGYSYGRSDLVRRAMGKKKMDVMLKEKENFIYGLEEEGVDGCVKRGIPEKIAEEIFNDMVSFAEYAFNKSHAAAYAVIGYQTAYLKTHYPVEFMAALMTSAIGTPENVAEYIKNAKDMGIEVLPPDVNESEHEFTVKDGKIRFGLRGIKGVGGNAISSIVNSREKNGAPQNISEFISGLDTHNVNKKVLENLIKAGATDSLNKNRAQSIAVYEQLLESAQYVTRKSTSGQISLFQTNKEEMKELSTTVNMPDIAPFSDEILGKMEKEMTGIYITAHPLDKYKDDIEKIVTLTAYDMAIAISDEEEESGVERQNEIPYNDGDKVRVAGIITNVKTLITKSNNMMAFLALEDLTGTMEVIVFYRTYEKYHQMLKEDSIIAIEGTVSLKEEEAPKIIANQIGDFGETVEKMAAVKKLVKLRISDNSQVEEVKKILKKYSGDCEVRIYMPDGKVAKTTKEFNVKPEVDFVEEMTLCLGKDNVKVGN